MRINNNNNNFRKNCCSYVDSFTFWYAVLSKLTDGSKKNYFWCKKKETRFFSYLAGNSLSVFRFKMLCSGGLSWVRAETAENERKWDQIVFFFFKCFKSCVLDMKSVCKMHLKRNLKDSLISYRIAYKIDALSSMNLPFFFSKLQIISSIGSVCMCHFTRFQWRFIPRWAIFPVCSLSRLAHGTENIKKQIIIKRHSQSLPFAKQTMKFAPFFSIIQMQYKV